MIRTVACIRGKSLHNDATPTFVQTSHCQLLQVLRGVQSVHICSIIIIKRCRLSSDTILFSKLVILLQFTQWHTWERLPREGFCSASVNIVFNRLVTTATFNNSGGKSFWVRLELHCVPLAGLLKVNLMKWWFLFFVKFGTRMLFVDCNTDNVEHWQKLAATAKAT